MSDSGKRLIGAAREALILAKDAEITRLQAELAAMTAERDAQWERAEDQADLVECACAYDTPTDLCPTHKRIVDRILEKRRAAIEVEAFNVGIEAAAKAIPTCGQCDAKVTIRALRKAADVSIVRAGEGPEIEIDVVKWGKYRYLYINGTRVSGGEPTGPQFTELNFDVPLADILKAIPVEPIDTTAISAEARRKALEEAVRFLVDAGLAAERAQQTRLPIRSSP